GCMPMMNTIRRMVPLDLESVVSIHLSSFQGFFLSFMGASFLRVFYRAVLFDEGNISFVSESGGHIVGFVVGTTKPYGFYKRVVMRYWCQLMIAAIVPVIRQPVTLLRLMRRLGVVSEMDRGQSEVLLMSIAVSPSGQNLGIGTQLIDAFIAEAKRRGISAISLTTDKINNEQANQFYFRRGFKCSSSFTTAEGRQMNEYRMELS
ncbi:MAG TPA: GNAT family N-acetyltransferase, partial [Anaerolineales bacterium]|nr:GNAT family N-acetyltransferase [Anaerolineales bacterium]